MVGLPFCSIPLNTIDSFTYLANEYRKAIAEYSSKAEESVFIDIKENSRRYKEFLLDDFKAFGKTVSKMMGT